MFGFIIAAVLLSGDFCFGQPHQLAVPEQFGHFQSAKKFSIDPSGQIYVIDGSTSQVLRLTRSDSILAATGGYGWSDGLFDQPADIIAPNGLDVYIADYGNHRIQRFDRTLSFVSSFSGIDEESTERSFGYPRSIDLSRQGSLLVTDGENNRILKLINNRIEATFGNIGEGKGRLVQPRLVRILDDDNVAVLDSNALVVFDNFGNYVMTLGNGVFQHVRSFTVHQNTIYVLDDSTIYTVKDRTTIERILLLNVPGRTSTDVPVDLAVYDDVLYLLMPAYISTKKLSAE